MPVSIKPLQLFVRNIPDTIHSHMLSRIANHLLRNQPVTQRLQVLDGKYIRLTVSDCDCSLRFIIHGGYLQPAQQTDANDDVHIRGKLLHFLLLATRNEDPDTLFFSRELSMEGNTADGLYFKNLLDALEFDIEAHLKTLFGNSLASWLTLHVQHLGLGDQLKSLGRQLMPV